MSTTASNRATRREGRVDVPGGWVWYEERGDGPQAVVLLHGGPGASSDYLEPLMAPLAERGYRVVRYDQLGSRRSARPDDASLWNAPRFVAEVDTVRQALGLGRVHLLGQSWGGMLGMEYALTQPQGIVSLTIASSPCSMALWLEEANRLREELPPEVQRTLLAHEAAGTTDSPEYEAAMSVFYQRHVCRLDPMPEPVQRSFAKLAANPEVYHTMNGPSEFHVVGTLKTWDVCDRLGEITIPTLVTSGRFDEATLRIAETVTHGIPGAQWVVFEESSHMAHAEQPEAYIEVLDAFLGQVEEAVAQA